jgi:hypothetical protein
MTTTTAEAARQAGVTIATIRTWCRRGVVAATKQAGRWVIDAASLAYRINLPTLLRPARKAVVLTAELVITLGGRRWQKNGMDRVYINDWARFAGLETSHYKTGNISGAPYQGEGISNSQAYKLLGSVDTVWFDAADGEMHCRYGYGESRVASRDEVFDAIVAGIRTAAAAL